MNNFDTENETKENGWTPGTMPSLENESGSGKDLEMLQMQDPEQKPKRTRSSFGTGIFAGILLGAIIAVGGTYGICRAANFQIVIGGKGASTVRNTKVLTSEAVNKIDEITKYMDVYYYEDYDLDDVQDSMYAGLVQGIGDKYSTYYNPEEYKESQVSTTGIYYGIGAGLKQDPDTMQVSITKIYEGTPSEEAGLKQDDIIITVDGIDATSKEVTDLVKDIRGEEGTKVHLEIYRPTTEETLEFDVERKNVELPSVSSQMLNDKVGYIQISEFQKNTSTQFETALADLQGKGMTSLVVDLRNNGGGLVSSVVKILDDILPEGTVVYTEDKYGNRQDYTSSGDTKLDIPMAVLINENSASASEIFAGAIKDYKYGTLIGTTTFGKGIVQTVYPLSSGDAIKITTAKYFTPNGNYIHGVGIDPDVELEYQFLGSQTDEYSVNLDNQIQKALEILQ